MKKKIFTLIAGLLLAVGWTDASAQLLPGAKQLKASFDYSAPSRQLPPGAQSDKVAEDIPDWGDAKLMLKAPRRVTNDYTITANAVHPKSWYDQWYYTYNDGTGEKDRDFTAPAIDPYQMMALTKLIYTESVFPGIKHSAPSQHDVHYGSVQFGWGINGTIFDDVKVTTKDRYTYIREITVADTAGNVLTTWTRASNGNTLPTGWTSTASLVNISYTDSTDVTNNACYMGNETTGGTITVPGSLLTNNTGGVKITLRYAASVNGTINVASGELNTTYNTVKRWTVANRYASAAISTPPDENGYTVMLVKLKDGVNLDSDPRATAATSSAAELRDYFNTYVSEMQLLTDGLRVAEGKPNAGTMFAYTGTLNRFFYISKGKMAALSGLESSTSSKDRAPFYNMYEEFSPDRQTGSTGIADFYAHMMGGTIYPIIHDCQSVIYQKHYFAMTGHAGNEEKYVTSLVLYIPDDRGDERGVDGVGSAWRDYKESHQPQLGLYTIHLDATATPVEGVDTLYHVDLDWTSSLNTMANENVPQKYYIYTIDFNEAGERTFTLIDSTEQVTTYGYEVPRTQTSYALTYMIVGTPIYPDEEENGSRRETFFAQSNPDDVQIPGWYDFLVLERERFESDFVIHEENNYYRNYLYPTNLAPLTGMTVEQLKQEWPNQTAQYVLWRNDQGVDKGVALLEVMAVGDKVYYRIRYQRDSQVTTGPNVIQGMNIVEIDDVNQ